MFIFYRKFGIFIVVVFGIGMLRNGLFFSGIFGKGFIWMKI